MVQTHGKRCLNKILDLFRQGIYNNNVNPKANERNDDMGICSEGHKNNSLCAHFDELGVSSPPNWFEMLDAFAEGVREVSDDSYLLDAADHLLVMIRG